MDLGSIFLILAIFIGSVWFVSQPFFGGKVKETDEGENEEQHRFSTLLAERDQVLDALQELEFDHAIGKVPEESYPIQRKILLERGTEVLRELDKLQVDEGDRLGGGGGDESKRIVAAVAARRGMSVSNVSGGVSPVESNKSYPAFVNSTVADPDDDLEVMLAERRRKRNDQSAGFCPKCGNPVQKSDRFCPKCGTVL
jgi:hypothetical protein